MSRYVVEVTWEYRKTFVITGDSEEAAVAHALLDAREDLAEAVEVGVDTEEFEVYLP